MKDWTGNTKSTYIAIGASNHSDSVREADDFYATDPIAIDKLVANYSLPNKIWECACGKGHLSNRLTELGFSVFSSDRVDRGFGTPGIDFLTTPNLGSWPCILTNPPYRFATEFVLHALEILPENGVCAMFLKTTFLEGMERHRLIFSKMPPKYVLQFSKRVMCAKNGEFDKVIAGGSAVAYAWFIWQKGHTGDTIIKWI